MLFADDGTNEIIYAGINGVVTIFVARRNRVMFALQLLVKTGFVRIEKRLFLRCEWCLELEGVDELLCKM